jgi:hypothetical protein
MKKIIFILLAVCFTIGVGYAQEEEAAPKKKKDRPVSEMFMSTIMMDEQTTMIPEKKTLEMQIIHRFGLLSTNGASDLWGIYAPSANTKMGLNFTPIENLELGYGITRKNMYSDFHAKYKILSQTRKNTVPVDVVIFANMAIDGRNETAFNTVSEDSVYKFANRMSYFTQVIVGRKFNDWFSLAVNASYSHYNTVPGIIENVQGMDHDKVGFGFLGKIKFSPQSSIIFHYSMPVFIKGISENTDVTFHPKPNFGFGYQVATATHSFEIFLTTANGILPQDNYMFNDSDWTKGEFRFGFTITRLWGF